MLFLLLKKKLKIGGNRNLDMKNEINFKYIGRLVQKLVEDLFKDEFTEPRFQNINLQVKRNLFLLNILPSLTTDKNG